MSSFDAKHFMSREFWQIAIRRAYFNTIPNPEKYGRDLIFFAVRNENGGQFAIRYNLFSNLKALLLIKKFETFPILPGYGLFQRKLLPRRFFSIDIFSLTWKTIWKPYQISCNQALVTLGYIAEHGNALLSFEPQAMWIGSFCRQRRPTTLKSCKHNLSID